MLCNKLNLVDHWMKLSYQLGSAYLCVGKDKKAEASFKTVLPCSLFYVDAQFQLGALSYTRGALSQSITHFREIPEGSIHFITSLAIMIHTIQQLIDGPMQDESQREPLETLLTASLLSHLKYDNKTRKRTLDELTEKSVEERPNIKRSKSSHFADNAVEAATASSHQRLACN